MVRPGWTLPVAALGVITLGIGWWQYHASAAQRTACDFLDIVNAMTGNNAASSCEAVRSKEILSLILIGVGLVEFLAGSLAASRRGLRSARQGHPWVLRRQLMWAARALDSRLPGYRETRPRISQAWIAAGLFFALFAGVVSVDNAWQTHTRTVREHRHAAAQRALQTLPLPAAIIRGRSDPVCTTAPDTLCAHSDKSPAALSAQVSALLHGAPNSALCTALAIPGDTVPCPTTIYGKVAGYPAVALISDHLITVRSGKPPVGATLAYPRSKTLYRFGSDITIGLAAQRP
jgi:hypothetical protein